MSLMPMKSLESNAFHAKMGELAQAKSYFVTSEDDSGNREIIASSKASNADLICRAFWHFLQLHEELVREQDLDPLASIHRRILEYPKNELRETTLTLIDRLFQKKALSQTISEEALHNMVQKCNDHSLTLYRQHFENRAPFSEAMKGALPSIRLLSRMFSELKISEQKPLACTLLGSFLSKAPAQALVTVLSHLLADTACRKQFHKILQILKTHQVVLSTFGYFSYSNSFDSMKKILTALHQLWPELQSLQIGIGHSFPKENLDELVSHIAKFESLRELVFDYKETEWQCNLQPLKKSLTRLESLSIYRFVPPEKPLIESQSFSSLTSLRIEGSMGLIKELNGIHTLTNLRTLSLILGASETPGTIFDQNLSKWNETLTNLTHLTLYCLGLNYSTHIINSLTQLKTLELRLDELTSPALKKIGSLPQLQKLHLQTGKFLIADSIALSSSTISELCVVLRGSAPLPPLQKKSFVEAIKSLRYLKELTIITGPYDDSYAALFKDCSFKATVHCLKDLQEDKREEEYRHHAISWLPREITF